jgi:hypothetical protein
VDPIIGIGLTVLVLVVLVRVVTMRSVPSVRDRSAGSRRSHHDTGPGVISGTGYTDDLPGYDGGWDGGHDGGSSGGHGRSY